MEDSLSPTKRALVALKQMQAQLDACERAKNEPIAIIGMGCRFPGEADSLEGYWRVLRDRQDAVTEVPEDRWAIDSYYDPKPNAPGKMCTREGGFVPHLQDFDAQFFRISPREAIGLDPQQRLLLEVSWEALENAAIAPERLMGTPAGVFVGISSTDYWHRLLARGTGEIDAYLGTGNSHSLASGRLSYTFGLTGPSLSVDTACSSSLVALHLAIASLRQQECNLALVGGVNRIISPAATINFSQARMLSPSGRCRTFDAAADGFVRGEGCGVIVLKRLSEAEAAGDNILAVIRGSATNQDGRTSGLTVPNGRSQQAVIRQALASSKVEPSEVSYIQTHGTGTALGDPMEVLALGEVFASDRPKNQLLYLGSVKTNIGHLEAAAGMASLIGTVLALQRQEIPANLHLINPNPHINWDELPFQVPTASLPWLRGEKPRIAGVSAFGFSGTNAHVILSEAPEKPEESSDGERPWHLVTLSAKNPQALQQLIGSYRDFLKSNPDVSLANLGFTANTGRSHFEYRAAVAVASIAELQQKLTALQQEQPVRVPTTPPKIAFVFGGDIPSRIDVGLDGTQPAFAQALEECDRLMQGYLGTNLREILDKGTEITVSCQQAALFSLEYALFKLWSSWGIEPSAVVGCGAGELVAACAAGVLSLADALKLATAQKEDVGAIAEKIAYKMPQIPFYAASGGRLNHEVTDPEYWSDYLQRQSGLKDRLELPEFCQVILDISLKPCLSEAKLLEKGSIYLSSLTPQGDWQQILDSLRRLYLLGVRIDWLGFDRDYSRRPIVLPAYPFQRQRYWVE